MFQRILLAWDGSAVALRAFDVAIGLSRANDAELVVVSVAYTPAHAETSADRDESADAARRYLVETFDSVRDRAERAGVDVDQRIIEGDDPAAVLLVYAHEHAFDLVVVGHHRSGRAGRLLLLRGVPGTLIEGARIPVLVVPEHDR